MNITEILRSVIINISENKLKVLLTMLGVIVGTLTVVIVLAIGEGSQQAVADQFKSLNVGTLQIQSAFGRNMTLKLTKEESDAIAGGNSHVKLISPLISSRVPVAYDGESNTVSTVGVEPQVQDIINIKMAYGRFLTQDDNDSKSKNVVIGTTLAETYFPDDASEAVEKTITVKGKKYTIVGVMQEQGDSTIRELTVDEAVLMPYSVAEKYITGRMVRPSIVVLADDINNVESVSDTIYSVLQQSFGTDSGQFMVINAGNRLETAKQSAKTLTLMLLAVAVVVLIVGGIGIMNVLFVSVKERTREIGILKAIGAKKRDILMIFLVEAVFISVTGSMAGIALSFIADPIISYFGVSMVIYPAALLVALGFSLTIGIFFGYYPAAKAASLKPIDALNYE